MNFAALIASMTVAEFDQRFARGDCFVIRGWPDKFTHLITLAEIEARLNDGCNLSTPVEVIDGGVRRPLVDNNPGWAPVAVRKGEVLAALRARRSILMRNSSQINPRVAALIDGIESHFGAADMRADLHLYISATREATAYNAHRDFPQHKIYLQAIGRTHWQIFLPRQGVRLGDDVRAITADREAELLSVAGEFDLASGDLLYMPPAVFHKVHNVGGPRVSFSIPFNPMRNNPPHMDRTYIPFREIFEQEMRAAAAHGMPESPSRADSSRVAASPATTEVP